MCVCVNYEVLKVLREKTNFSGDIFTLAACHDRRHATQTPTHVPRCGWFGGGRYGVDLYHIVINIVYSCHGDIKRSEFFVNGSGSYHIHYI